MKDVINQKKDIIDWFNWLNKKWNNYEAFIDFEVGKKPKEVAEEFVDMNKAEFNKLIKNFDKEDLDTIDQFQKLIESESHVFKIIKDQIDFQNKVKFVDFKRKIY